MRQTNNSEVYINGVLAATSGGRSSSYRMVPISDAAKQALISNGNNVIAIHSKRNNRGRQYIDAGISVMSFDRPLSSTSEKK